MLFNRAEQESYSPVVSFETTEVTNGVLVSDNWNKVHLVVTGYMRSARDNGLDFVTGRFTPAKAEILKEPLDASEEYQLQNLQNFNADGYSSDTGRPGAASIYAKVLKENRFWLHFGFPNSRPYVTLNERKALFDQSLADAFGLSYGVSRQNIEVKIGLAQDEKSRINKDRLLAAIQSATEVHYDPKTLKEFPFRPVVGESPLLVVSVQLHGFGEEEWFVRGHNLELGKQVAEDTEEVEAVLYPRMSLVLRPSERIADIIHQRGETNSGKEASYDATTFDAEAIESMRMSVQKLREVFRVGAILYKYILMPSNKILEKSI